ncbi:MAG: segregation/condensation protein A, partial [Chloroflexaceae bacterium]|nr:segregation/condensation protein A [Chloroflexaceae bacterium]
PTPPDRLPDALERHLRRRSAAPPLRKRRVTLQELIEQIQQLALELEKKTPPAPPRPRQYTRQEAAQQIAHLAHNENLTEMAGQLEAFFPTLKLHSPDWIDLEQLLDWWARATTPDSGPTPQKDRVGIFWALLLLSSQSKVELVQAEFYQDLKIRPLL